MSYEALVSMLVDRTDQNAPNQAMVMSRAIVDAKTSFPTGAGQSDVLTNFTIDSAVPFATESAEFNRLSREMVPGAISEKRGDFQGELSRNPTPKRTNVGSDSYFRAPSVADSY
ncbi:hypothetical protein AAE026_31240 [Bradyrhizobium sp. DN5]|uniref:hypothetical protein n=1 Tax=Bradyrhizobium sp. DN5 TaxID=3056950 RepID=UPI003525D999